MTSTEFAARVGTGDATVTHWLRGTHPRGADAIAAIAATFGVTTEYVNDLLLSSSPDARSRLREAIETIEEDAPDLAWQLWREGRHEEATVFLKNVLDLLHLMEQIR